MAGPGPGVNGERRGILDPAHGRRYTRSATMRHLGLDVGDRRIGVALSDETATLASGLETLPRVGPRKDVRAVAELVRRHGVGEVVVGLPRRLDGGLGPQAQKVLDFADALRVALAVPVVPWDERMTTVVAQRALLEADLSRRERKAVVDKVSAILILQSYLDYRKLAESENRGSVP
jgi:putative Holliday junction resolvase